MSLIMILCSIYKAFTGHQNISPRDLCIRFNNNNFVHLYSAFLGTQSALHSKGGGGESPHPPPVCSIHLMIRRQP